MYSDKRELIQFLTDSIHSGAKYDSVLYQLSETIAQGMIYTEFKLTDQLQFQYKSAI